MRRFHRSFTTSRPSTRALAGVGQEQGDQDPEQGGLAGAVGADHAVELARRHVERHLLQRRVVAEAAHQAPRLDRGAVTHRRPASAAMVSSPGIPIRSRPSGLATATFTAYTWSARSSRVWIGVGVNSAADAIQVTRPGMVAIESAAVHPHPHLLPQAELGELRVARRRRGR